VSAKATVTVSRVPVARIVIAPSSPTVIVGHTTQLSATPQDSAGNALTGITVTWSSSDPMTATIDQTGSAVGMKAGVVTLTVTSGSVTASSSLTVRAAPGGAVANVVVTPDAATITNSNNSSVQLTATLVDTNGNTVVGPPITWSSDNTHVAVVSSTGVVRAAKHHSQGTATITATSEGIQGTAIVTVVDGHGGQVPPSS
jgi:trimeric autotransporter adhesin